MQETRQTTKSLTKTPILGRQNGQSAPGLRGLQHVQATCSGANNQPILLHGLRGRRHRRSRLQYARAARRLCWLPGLNPPTLSPHAVCAMARAHASLVHGSGLVASAAACRALGLVVLVLALALAFLSATATAISARHRSHFRSRRQALSSVTLLTRAATVAPSCRRCTTPPSVRRG